MTFHAGRGWVSFIGCNLVTAAVYHFIKMRRDIRRSKTHKGVIGLQQGSLAGGEECAQEREKNYIVLTQRKILVVLIKET